MSQATTIDPVEIEKFTAMAADWWNPAGKFRPLHKFNPVRLSYIREMAIDHFDRDAREQKPFEGLRLLDIGCGGGLLCEPMTRLGFEVVGVDAAEANVEVARIHARQTDLEIDYRATTAESLAATGDTFDVVLNMEVVEHVADVELFMTACCQLVKPGGLIFNATINRTAKANLLAIFMAENLLRWLPKGTHDFDKLVTPSELMDPIEAAGLKVIDRTGVTYNPFADRWGLSSDMAVNYMVLAGKPTSSK